MPTMTAKAGPWNMTVFAFEAGDPENPLAGVSAEDVERLPFGAAELNREGNVVAYNDTEPDGLEGPRPVLVGRDFFNEVARWAGRSVIADEFRRGVDSGELNVVFDCAVAGVSYKVRIHLKISPILGTYWVFVKKLKRA